MSRTVIQCGLGSDEITRVRQELLNYKRDFLKKVDIFRERLAEEIRAQADLNFASSIVDDVINGSSRHADVKVTISDGNNITVVVAEGEDAVWCEFGASHRCGVFLQRSVPWYDERSGGINGNVDRPCVR